MAQFWIFAIVAAQMMAPGLSDEMVFSSQPKATPYYVTENDEGPLLECSVAAKYAMDTNNYELGWTKVVNGRPTSLTHTDRTYKPDSYELIQSSSEGTYNLKIRKVNFTEDNGMFFCSMIRVHGGFYKYEAQPATVVVLVRPDPPQIAHDLPTVSEEGTRVQSTCTSRNGNPPPVFNWLFRNKTTVPEEWQIVKNASRPDQESSSTIEWQVGPSDDRSYLICQIWNQAIGPGGARLTVETRRMNVHYRPRVSVGPVEEYNVENGRRARLTCIADANPEPAQYSWEQIGGGERWDEMDKEFVIEKKHQGEFVCKATNSVGTGQAKLLINVLYGPRVDVHNVLNPDEGDNVVLPCDAVANPPAESVFWETPKGRKEETTQLKINNISRSDRGNYTCRARNTLTLFDSRKGSEPRTGMSVTIVDVKYSPGKARIKISDSPVVVGQEVILSCTADELGSPPAQFRWAAPGKDFEQNSRDDYVIISAQLTDAGDYRCLPWNSVGEGEIAGLTLQIMEPARLTQLLPLSELVTDGHERPMLECKAQGHPAPNIIWLKDGRRIDPNLMKFSVETRLGQTECDRSVRCSYPVTGILKWKSPVKWNDKGQYSCEAYNGAGTIQISDSVLSVIHSPVILNSKFPEKALAAADFGTTAHISCMASARPEPTFRWFRRSTEIFQGGRYVIRWGNGGNSSRDDYESILEIQNISNDDLGDYMCSVTNGRTNKPAKVIINLQTKTKPHPPKYLRQFEVSYNWMLIGWSPGFDGGDPQQFILQYRPANPWTGSPSREIEPTTIKLKQTDLLMVLFDEDEINPRNRRVPVESPKFTQYVLHNLTDLAPLNSYWFRVGADNKFGVTDFLPENKATTEDVPERAHIAVPENANYDPANRKLSFKPSPSPLDYCLMIYVKAENQPWSSVNCTQSSMPATNIEYAANMRVRFCTRRPPFVCSKQTAVIIVTSMSLFPLDIILPVILLVAALLIVAGVIGLCCRMRSKNPKKQQHQQEMRPNNKMPNYDAGFDRPKVSSPYTSEQTARVGDLKNVHGSQGADSGIFTTLGSQMNGQHLQQQQSFDPNGNAYDPRMEHFANTAVRASYEEGVDRWGSTTDPLDYGAADPYSAYPHDYQDNGAYFDGYSSNMVDLNPAGGIQVPEYDDDASSFSTPNSRRVMREIIV